jgi:N-acetylglucosamine-6-sulfatase
VGGRSTVLTALLVLASVGISPAGPTQQAVAATRRPNVVIVISDDQRWDKITHRYMPRVYQLATNPSAIRPSARSVFFQNAFVSNPLCCPSRATILSGRYSHTTGVWDNGGAHGGFSVFDDRHTMAVDFRRNDYRTAMIGKYMNGYSGGGSTYVPPGWTRWFASSTGAYYNWGATVKSGNRVFTRHFGTAPEVYSTRVLTSQAVRFVTRDSTKPFFLYFSPSAPHGPAIPDPRDVGRFQGDPDFRYFGTSYPSSSLESAYGVDRAVGRLLSVLPNNTVVLFMSDNGYQWHDATIRGVKSSKRWPYNESIRVPMIYASLNGTRMPRAAANDIVANVDLRTSLLHAVGLAPLTSQQGRNWFDSGYVPRLRLGIEAYRRVTYCGIRTKRFMYARFHEPTGAYRVELYQETTDPTEVVNLAQDPAFAAVRRRMHDQARARCNPAPPGYRW